LIEESFMTISSLNSSPLHTTFIERSNSVEIDLFKQSALNKQAVEAYHACDMFQASELFFEGANPNLLIPVTERMLLLVDLMEHPNSYIEKFFEDSSHLNIATLIQNYPHFGELICEIKELQEQGEHVPSKLVRECVLIGVQEEIRLSVGDPITPLHWAILNEDSYMVKDLLMLGADISICQDSSILQQIQISGDGYWDDDIKLRQTLIDHGLPFEILIPEGVTLKELILKIAVEWNELKLMKFVAHNIPTFKKLIYEKDEQGKSLYNRICKEIKPYSQILKFLSEAEKEPDSLSDFEKRVSATLHVQEKSDFSRYWASSSQRA